MNTELLERLARIDPYPVDAEPPTGVVDAAAVLNEIEWRTTMDVKELTTSPKTPRRKWKAALVAAGAFAAVLIVGVAIALTAAGDGENEPAGTVPAPPTTAAGPTTTETVETPPTTAAVVSDEVSADQLALAEAFVADMHSPGPLWASYFAEPRVIEIPGFGDGWTIAAGGPHIQYESILLPKSELGECTLAGERVSCRVYHTDLFTETVDIDAYWDRWSFIPRGGLVADVRWLHDAGDRSVYRFELALFQSWVDEHHPEAGVLVSNPGTLEDWVLGLTEEEQAMLPALIAEYAASLG